MGKSLFDQFTEFWMAFNPDPQFNNRWSATWRLWYNESDERRAELMASVANGGPKGRNPYFYIIDFRSPREQTLTYTEYYARYGTTAETDGWQMANPTGQKVIYVKAG